MLMRCLGGFAQAGGLDKILGIGGLGYAEESNFVAAAAPALRPPAERKRLRRGFLWAGWNPAPSGELGWAVRARAVVFCATPTSYEERL